MEAERSFNLGSWNPIKSRLLERGVMWLNDRATLSEIEPFQLAREDLTLLTSG